MRTVWLTTILLACLCACGGEPSEPAGELKVAGVWVLDVEAFRTAFVRVVEKEIEVQARRGSLPPEEADRMRTQLLQDVHERFSAMWARFTFKEDGTFMSEGSDGTLVGRWGLHGIRLVLTVTEEKGEVSAEPSTWPGTAQDDVIRLRPEADKDYEIVLHPAE